MGPIIFPRALSFTCIPKASFESRKRVGADAMSDEDNDDEEMNLLMAEIEDEIEFDATA